MKKGNFGSMKNILYRMIIIIMNYATNIDLISIECDDTLSVITVKHYSYNIVKSIIVLNTYRKMEV